MNLLEIRSSGSMLLECVSGSRAYGLQTPQSDTDIKGVFVLPKPLFYGLNYIEQLQSDSNDEVFYELKRFVDLLAKNNPNLLELLATPKDSIISRHPLMDLLVPEMFLSRLCLQTFAGYAQTQINKSRGLNKKIVNPMSKDRKSVLHFCYVILGHGSVPLIDWLQKNQLRQEDCGLVSITHARDTYALFHTSTAPSSTLMGISSGAEANNVLLSAVEKGVEPIAILNFNKDSYSNYCFRYREYWDWVEQRNDVRYQGNIEHGKNYDSKNIMHTFRLLAMAEEIATEKKINVRRHDRDFLLKIRRGDFEYEELLAMVAQKVLKIQDLYEKSDLPDSPDIESINAVLVRIRETWYKRWRSS